MKKLSSYIFFLFGKTIIDKKKEE